MKFLIRAANAAVGVEAGRIAPPAGPFDFELLIPDGELGAGLINAHDHLHRNHYGRLGEPPYANAYEWARDIQSRGADEIAAGRTVPRREALIEGAWKNLFAGVTTVVHHDRWEAAFDQDFPIRVTRIRTADSLGFDSDAVEAGSGPFAVHLAEGVDSRAAEEVRELDGRGLLTADLLAVHMCGTDLDGELRFRASGAAVVWCPSSNLRLFGATASATLLAQGVDVLLGTDSLLTGDGDLLDELAVARRLGRLDDARLLDAVGRVAARRLDLPEPSLQPGAPADLAVFRKPVLGAGAEDVALVVVGGQVRLIDPALAPALGDLAGRGIAMTRNGVTRWTSAVSGDRSSARFP